MLPVIKIAQDVDEDVEGQRSRSSDSFSEDEALAVSGMQMTGGPDFGLSDTNLKQKTAHLVEMKHLKTSSASRVTFKRTARPRSMIGDVYVEAEEEEDKEKEKEKEDNSEETSRLQRGVTGLKRIFKRSQTTQGIQGTLARTRKRKKSKEFVILNTDDAEERILLITGDTAENVRSVSLAQALEQSRAHQREKQGFWIDFQGLEHSQLQQVAVEFGIHPLTIEDILDGASREKSESFHPGYFCTSISEAHLEKEKKEINLVEVTILLFNSFLLTFHPSPVKSLEKALRSLQESGAGGIPPDWVAYAIEDAIIDMYSVFVTQLRDKVHSLEELALLISSRRQRDVLKTINSLRRSISDMRAQLFSKRDLLRLQMKDDSFFRSTTKVYLRSLFDHITQLLLVLDMASETVNNTNSTYLARISVEMAEASQQLGELMKRFSSVGLILLPLSLVAGIWGMNVKVPGQEDDNLFWFGGIVSVMVAYALVLTIAFFHFDWL